VVASFSRRGTKGVVASFSRRGIHQCRYIPLERQIDEMVYKLYGLTEEEMKPVFINVGAGLVPALI